MVTATEVGWGSYKAFEGPYYKGRCPFLLPAAPSEAEKVMAVITATEGGRYDAVNMYDRMILSVGLIQYGEASQFSVSDMLGAVVEKDETLLSPLDEVLAALGVAFLKNAKGRWRFFLGGTKEVTTLGEQQQLFLRCDGLQGSWTDTKKLWAKTWAASVANVFAQVPAQEAQAEFIAPRLRGFAMASPKAFLWGAGSPTDTMGWPGAIRAAFLSFAANLPATAGAQFDLAMAGLKGTPAWSKDWCIALLKQLTFGPGIAIYPERYNKIRPVVERLYGVDLPDFATELKLWQAQMKVDPTSEVPTFMAVREIQEELLALGYDLGPAGADGKAGVKTSQAVAAFQKAQGLTSDGLVGPKTRLALATSWAARH